MDRPEVRATLGPSLQDSNQISACLLVGWSLVVFLEALLSTPLGPSTAPRFAQDDTGLDCEFHILIAEPEARVQEPYTITLRLNGS